MQSPADSISTFRRVTGIVILFTERFVLAYVFLLLAWSEIDKVRNILSWKFGSQAAIYIGTAQHLILFVVCCLTILLLLLGRRAFIPPQNVQLIFVPLLATFFPFLYFTIKWLPASFQINLCPPDLQMTFVYASVVAILVGPIVALWGILYLGRSFGIFVTLRKVVLRGPYRWVRHPMYLGWACSYIGFALVNFSAAYILIVSIHLLIILYRAHLEETELAKFSPEYREYMQRTGFFFPKFRRSIPAAQPS